MHYLFKTTSKTYFIADYFGLKICWKPWIKKTVTRVFEICLSFDENRRKNAEEAEQSTNKKFQFK